MITGKKNIIVLTGGPSAEHKVSLATGRVIVNSLDKNRYNIKPITITKDGMWLLPPPDTKLIQEGNAQGESLVSLETGKALDQLKSEKSVDVVFIAMHGSFGEDGTIQGFLELAGVPYTGSGVLASALAMNKIKSMELFSFHGLNVPRYIFFSKQEWMTNGETAEKISTLGGSQPKADQPPRPRSAKRGGLAGAKTSGGKNEFALPIIIKPSNCGSSVGVTIVRKLSELHKAIRKAFVHDSMVIAQEYIPGTEVTCAVLDEGGHKKPLALPPTQIIPKNSEFFDYYSKYTPGATEEITPPRLPSATIKKIQDNALKVHQILGCSGMSRTDMIVAGDDVYVLETNTIPGMTETSLYPQAAAAIGISFPELLDKIIQAALNRKQFARLSTQT